MANAVTQRLLRRSPSGEALTRRALAGPLAAAAGLGAAALVDLSARIRDDGHDAPLQTADAIVVFGASVWPSGPSLTMRVRCDRAARVYAEGLAPVVLCSGGHSGGISEAAVMRALLVEHGLPESAVIPDDGGSSTRETIRSVAAIGWQRIIAVTSDYHVHRVLAEARRHGVEALPCPARRPEPRRLDTSSGRRLLAFDVRQHARELVAVPAYAVTGYLDRGAGLLARRAAIQAQAYWRAVTAATDATADASEWIADLIRARAELSSGGLALSPRDVQLTWPAAGAVTSRFGMRHGRLHTGLDIGAAYGAPVRPALPGEVLHAGWLNPYGNVVVVAHGGGLASLYAHLAGIVVAEGDSLRPGQLLGYSGATGNSFGPHLHFEVRIQGAPVDPLVYLRNGDAPQPEPS